MARDRARLPRGATKRRRRAAPRQHAQCQFPRLDLGNASHGARSRGRLRLEWLGLHGRVRRRLACPARHGSVAGARRLRHSLLVRQRNDRFRNRADGRRRSNASCAAENHRSPRTRRNMLSFSQLEFSLAPSVVEKPPGRDPALEALARDLLLQQGATSLAAQVRVEWSTRLRTAAGRAEYGARRILLNRRLAAHGEAEIDRTLRHELAHLLAQFRAGRRRIAPHGMEWRRACTDLGIEGEARCHNLPFPAPPSAAPLSLRLSPLPARLSTRLAHCGAPPPASPVAGPSIAAATTAASSSVSLGVRRILVPGSAAPRSQFRRLAETHSRAQSCPARRQTRGRGARAPRSIAATLLLFLGARYGSGQTP